MHMKGIIFTTLSFGSTVGSIYLIDLDLTHQIIINSLIIKKDKNRNSIIISDSYLLLSKN